MNVVKVVKTVLFWEILQGLLLTLKSMVGRPVTRLYPYEKRTVQPGFRGLHALIRNPKTGREKCVACGLCAAVCPSQCITIHAGEGSGLMKVAEGWDVDVLRCLFCGLCVEACPVGALALTEHFEYASYSRGDFLYNKDRLLANCDLYLSGERGESYLTNFWQPAARNFRAYAGQAVFSGRTPQAPASPAPGEEAK